MTLQKIATLDADLRRRLEAAEWPPGTLMPTERQLAGEYGVARNTIRKILTRMVEEGLIERRVGSGTMVLDRPDNQFADILDRFLDASPIDILNLRIFIEPHSAEAAARNASSSELEAIVEADARCSAATDLELFEHWNSEFHRRIHLAAHNAFLTDLYDLMVIIRFQAPMMEIRRRSFTEERRLAYGVERGRILTALRNWDGKAAAEAMRALLMSRRRNYFGQ
ncbi:FadR/GntR family transcriptional regulator [Seohaeicola zhoushanensis]|uniref:GntR family transcriptional regulator n=1 Tax=Seohaeicola zhoushanensis TaxID=1569283 RepID=A0A8J3M7Y0_9RHOB|nr:GntR family transcriptional regulator [Seohaeicola zhoushanensis]GHF55478.1 GntR family transcriptional regulator [Seohaeicola zhoushanensis]